MGAIEGVLSLQDPCSSTSSYAVSSKTYGALKPSPDE
jgi:hypothetical protein